MKKTKHSIIYESLSCSDVDKALYFLQINEIDLCDSDSFQTVFFHLKTSIALTKTIIQDTVNENRFYWLLLHYWQNYFFIKTESKKLNMLKQILNKIRK